MNMRDNLLSLELLRDFVRHAVSLETYMKNLIIDNIETSNKRIWALRERLELDEATFAHGLNIGYKEYHMYEKDGNPIPEDFLKTVADKFAVPLDWLLCKVPMLPVPLTPKK